MFDLATQPDLIGRMMEQKSNTAELDPDLAAIAARVANLPSPFADWRASRMQMEEMASRAAAAAAPIDVASISDLSILERSLALRIYQPAAPRCDATIMFFHGGGYVLGGVNHSDRTARKLCRDAGAVVVSVDYRLAPEHPFPSSHEDARDAALWASQNIASLGGNIDRLILMGESAGANLAACAAIAMRDLEIPILAQVLIVPGLDFARDVEALLQVCPSPKMYTPQDMDYIFSLFLNGDRDAARRCPPSPLRADDLTGVAPAIIVTAGHCILAPEGAAYADRLTNAGVKVELQSMPNMLHTFFGMFDASTGAMEANNRVCEAIRKVARGS